MNNRIDAIYARQSVDKKDSISIESQIEFCKYELKGGSCREYTDKGYSGKNTDRPKFQELVRDIKKGLIAKVIVYKLDRISRSILDFATMMELFQQYNVEFVSSTEKFDTSTPMGRAMLNICIVFAQLERETIQKRVTDAYYSRSQRGFKMGGKAPYGFHTEPIKMDGINTKRLVVKPEEAANIRLMFEMYAEPTTSYGDITRHFAEQGILFNGRELIRPTLAQMLRNPVYVQADLDVYEFFKSQGTVLVNDVADFTGMNGCYLYQGRDVKPGKAQSLKDQMLVLAPHEGIVPLGYMADLPQEADEQHENPVRPESHPYMAGGENQVRELRVRPYEYLQSLRQTVPPLYETAGQQKLSRLWENHHGGTGSGGVSADGEKAGQLQDTDGQEESGKGQSQNHRPASGTCPCG